LVTAVWIKASAISRDLPGVAAGAQTLTVSSLPLGKFGEDRYVVQLAGKLLNASDELNSAAMIRVLPDCIDHRQAQHFTRGILDLHPESHSLKRRGFRRSRSNDNYDDSDWKLQKI
jgi:hypothetical protein